MEDCERGGGGEGGRERDIRSQALLLQAISSQSNLTISRCFGQNSDFQPRGTSRIAVPKLLLISSFSWVNLTFSEPRFETLLLSV